MRASEVVKRQSIGAARGLGKGLPLPAYRRRLSESVPLYCAFGSGPSQGGAGAGPRVFFPATRCAGRAATLAGVRLVGRHPARRGRRPPRGAGGQRLLQRGCRAGRGAKK